MKDLARLLRLSDGNPGASICLIGIYEYSSNIINQIDSLGIKGTEIYVLFNDICNQDYILFQIILNKCNSDDIRNAARKQDYLGVNIPSIKKILDVYKNIVDI